MRWKRDQARPSSRTLAASFSPSPAPALPHNSRSAPDDKAAGLDLHVRIGDVLAQGAPLCTVHAESPGELDYALAYAAANPDIFEIAP
jgi:hypothetical protein